MVNHVLHILPPPPKKSSCIPVFKYSRQLTRLDEEVQFKIDVHNTI